MFRRKLLHVCLLLTAIGSVSMAGSKIDGWVMDDFESYTSTADMKATSLTTGGPWWILQELENVLFGKPIAAGATLEINLATSPPHGTGDPNDTNDPNGFTAIGEIDASGPQSVEVHYQLTSEASSCDLLTLAHNLGLPYVNIPTGQPAPLDTLPVADFTTIGKMTMKVKKNSSNITNLDSFAVGLIGPDIKLIGQFRVLSTSPGNDFLEYPDNVWETVEFDINGVMDTANADSAFGRDMVSAIVIGTYDTAGSDVRYLLDDITFFNEGEPCGAYDPADINMDCDVNMIDLSALASAWLSL